MQEEVSAEEKAKWHRRFAIECNNRAWRLAELTARTVAEEAEMLDAAHAAALHWGAVGTDLHKARTAMLLGQVQALLGQGSEALRNARAAFDYVATHDSPAWEVAFAHAILANAGAAAGQATLHREHHARAEALGEALADAEDREIFFATFRTVPRPR